MATAATVFRDYETDGVPASGSHKVKKSDVRGLLTGYESIINAFTANGGLIFSSKASLDASLTYAANTMAWVIGDATVVNNGVYGKVGASGTGSWTRRADLPFSFIIASDVGAGTANAIQATTSLPVSGSALIWMNVFEANTASPVTVSFNGGSALTIKTNSGNDVAAGGLTAGMIVMGIVSGGTFRLVSDQASAAIVAAAEAAQAAAEVAQAAAEAAAAAVNLPNVVADTMLVANSAGTLRENKTFRQVRDLLDPLRLFNADGATDDTANFTALEALVSGQDIDLRSRTFSVTAIPKGNKYRNGWWLIPNADDGADIIYPARDTLRPLGSPINLAPSERYSAWPQGKGDVYRSEVFVIYNTGGSHDDATQHPVLRRSGDNGASFKDYPLHLFQQNSGTERYMCFGSGIIDGQHVISVFREQIGVGIIENYLYGRRIYEYKNYSALRMTTTAASSQVTIYEANHGLKVGDRINFPNSIVGVGGLTLSGTKTVLEGFETNFVIDAGSPAASTSDATYAATLIFLEDAFTEITFGGQSFGSAVNTFSADITGQFTQGHTIVGIPASAGDLYVPIHGGGATGPWVVGVNNIFRGAPTRLIGSVTRIGGLTEGIEPTLDRDLVTGNFYGAIRTQSASYPWRFFWLPAGGTFNNAVVSDGDASPFALYSPITMKVVGSKIFGITSGSRNTGGKAEVGLYILEASIADAESIGAAAFRKVSTGNLNYTDFLLNDQANAIGVPGMFVTDDNQILGLLWSDQFQSGVRSEFGQPSIFLQRFWIGPDQKLDTAVPPDEIGWAGRTPELAYWPQEDVTTLSAHFDTNGALLKRTFARGLRLACVTPNASPGIYLLSFQDRDGNAVNLGHANYYPQVTTYGAAHFGEVRNVTSTGFDVRTYDAAGAAVNRQFVVTVRIDNEWVDDRD